MFTSHATLKAARLKLRTLRRRLADLAAPGVRSATDTEELQLSIAAEIKSLEKAIMLQDGPRTAEQSLAEPGSMRDLPDVLINARLARGITQRELADFVGMKYQQIQQYEIDLYQGASFRRLKMIADALGVEIFQTASLIGTPEMGALDWSNPHSFPLAEMSRRGWLGEPDLSPRLARQAHDLLDAFFTASFGNDPPRRRRFVRSSAPPHEGAITAWEAAVILKADRRPLRKRFDADAVSRDWLRELSQMSSTPKGLTGLQGNFANIGIRLVLEPNLPAMHIDGAAILTPANQHVIALTLENWRAEWFWLTLMHELAHLVLHIGKGTFEAVFDEVGAHGQGFFEEDADAFAREALIPASVWRTCRSQHEFTSQAIKEDSRRLGLGTALVVARAMDNFGHRHLPSGIASGRDMRPLLRQAAW